MNSVGISKCHINLKREGVPHHHPIILPLVPGPFLGGTPSPSIILPLVPGPFPGAIPIYEQGVPPSLDGRHPISRQGVPPISEGYPILTWPGCPPPQLELNVSADQDGVSPRHWDWMGVPPDQIKMGYHLAHTSPSPPSHPRLGLDGTWTGYAWSARLLQFPAGGFSSYLNLKPRKFIRSEKEPCRKICYFILTKHFQPYQRRTPDRPPLVFQFCT